MAERIEGLSIELDLETMKINSGLKDLKSQLTTVNSEMKANMSAFDRSDKTIVKYETRLNGLNKKLEVQQAVTDSARKSYEKMVKEHGEGSEEAQKAAKEYNNQVAALNNLSRYVERVEKDLSQLREEQRIANSNWTKLGNTLDSAGNKMKNFGDKASGVGNALSKTVTPAVIGMGTAMGLVASSYEDSAVKIQNSLGLTAEETKELTDISRNIYKNGFGESAEEIDTALLQTKQNIRDLNNEDLERITEKAFLLADTFESDVNEVTRAGNNIMKGFGLEADEAFDLMAKGAQNGLNFSNEMFDNLSEYSTLFGNMGYSAEEYFELLQKGTEAGVYNLDYINDVMKEFQIRVKDGSKTTSDAMDKLSEETQTVWKEFNKGDKTVKDVSNAVLKELKGMDDQVSANQVGVELFGTKFEDLESEAMYALGDIGDGLEDVDGTMDDMTKNTERSISRQWKSTWREAKEVLLPVGETLLDFTREVLPDVKDGIEGVTEWFEELDEEGKKNIIMFGGIAAAAGPVLSVVGGLSSGIGGLLKVGGSLSALLGKAGGTALLGKLGALGLTGPVGMAVAGVAGLTAVTYGLSKATEENLEDTLSSIDTRKKEIESVDELIEKFGALQEKNKLSSDEILRYMDISDELKEAKTEKTIEKLKDEQADLLKKSKLTNEEMEEFLELNEEVVKKAPATSSVISDQGNAYADVLEKLEDLNEAERNRLMNDTYDAITEELNNHKVALEKQKDLQIEIAKQESDRSTRLDELNKLSEELKQKDLDIADIKKEMSTLSGEERLKLSEKLLQEEEARRLLVSQKEGHEEIISKIDKTISKKKESLDDTKEELAAFNDLAGEYEAMILKQVNINAEKGKGLKTVESEIETLEKKRQKYIELSRENDGNTQAYKDQAKELGEQISKLDAAKKELENINEIAGRTIYQSRIVNVKFHARYSGFKTGDSANIGLVGGGGYQEYAKGTDYHPGGPFLAGEEGPELGRLGNRWEMLEFGMYKRPAGYQVFTNEETKNIMKAFNSMPGYATGISPDGEADRIVNSLRNNSFNKLLALLGKQATVPNQSIRQTSVIDYTKELLTATLEQNELLTAILSKDNHTYLDGKQLEPVISSIQARKQFKRGRRP